MHPAGQVLEVLVSQGLLLFCLDSLDFLGVFLTDLELSSRQDGGAMGDSDDLSLEEVFLLSPEVRVADYLPLEVSSEDLLDFTGSLHMLRRHHG